MEKNDSLIQHSIFMFSSDWNKENKKKSLFLNFEEFVELFKSVTRTNFFLKKNVKPSEQIQLTTF